MKMDLRHAHIAVLAIPAACLLCVLPLTQASCCGPIPPPEFRLGAPPMPPGLKIKVPFCQAMEESHPRYTLDQYNQSMHHSPDGATTHDDHIPSTPPTFPSTDNKKPVSIGMILGVIIGLLFLLVVCLVAWMLTKKKNLKYQIEPESDQEKQGNFLYNYRIRGWFWRKSDTKGKGPKTGRPGRAPQHGVKRGERSMSTTSSESGYCEEPAVESHSEKVAEAPPVLRRPRKNTPDSRPLAGSEATPDIIASTQIQEPETPKRWSLFGLLPSLKPVLVSRGLDGSPPEIESPDADPNTESPDLSAASRLYRNRSPPPDGRNDGISMKLLGAPSWIKGKKSDSSSSGTGSDLQADDDDVGSQNAQQKKSRIRIKPNSKKMDPEVNV